MAQVRGPVCAAVTQVSAGVPVGEHRRQLQHPRPRLAVGPPEIAQATTPAVDEGVPGLARQRHAESGIVPGTPGARTVTLGGMDPDDVVEQAGRELREQRAHLRLVGRAAAVEPEGGHDHAAAPGAVTRPPDLAPGPGAPEAIALRCEAVQVPAATAGADGERGHGREAIHLAPVGDRRVGIDSLAQVLVEDEAPATGLDHHAELVPGVAEDARDHHRVTSARALPGFPVGMLAG